MTGLTVTRARVVLINSGCKLGRTVAVASGRKRGVIVAQVPAFGTNGPAGIPVAVGVAR